MTSKVHVLLEVNFVFEFMKRPNDSSLKAIQNKPAIAADSIEPE